MIKKKIIVIGTFDDSIQRIKLILKGSQNCNNKLEVINFNIWHDIIKHKLKLIDFFKIFIRTLKFYILNFFKIIKAIKNHEFILIPYPAYIDLIFLYPICKFYKKKIILDVFISIFNTIIEDRELIKNYFLKKTIHRLEKLFLNISDYILIETNSYKNYFKKNFDIANHKFIIIPHGVDNISFNCELKIKKYKTFTVLFYGTFSPLHGSDILFNSMNFLKNKKIRWIIIGKGQEDYNYTKIIKNVEFLNSIKRINWVSLKKLNYYINKSHLIIGALGFTKKSKLIIPQKFFQAIYCRQYVVNSYNSEINKLSRYFDNIYTLKKSSYIDLAEIILSIKKKYKGPIIYNKHQISILNQFLPSNLYLTLTNEKY